MHYSIIKPKCKKEIIEIDKGSLKTKRKFAFLLEIGDKILNNKEFYAMMMLKLWLITLLLIQRDLRRR